MSNQAQLFAHDDPAPVELIGDDADYPDGLVQVAGAAYAVPVFWLFCFDPGDLGSYHDGETSVPTLVAPMGRVKARLADRERLALRLFADNAGVWREWRAAIEGMPQPYLKAEMQQIDCLTAEGVLARQLASALEWIARGNGTALGDVLALAGIEHYDRKAGRLSFDPDRECAEKFLYGWLEEDDG